MKALTLTYNDGVELDRRLVEILKYYNMKGTFNLNGGLQSRANEWTIGDVVIRRINVAGLPELYKGHEVTFHSLTHPRPENLDMGPQL